MKKANWLSNSVFKENSLRDASGLKKIWIEIVKEKIIKDISIAKIWSVLSSVFNEIGNLSGGQGQISVNVKMKMTLLVEKSMK